MRVTGHVRAMRSLGVSYLLADEAYATLCVEVVQRALTLQVALGEEGTYYVTGGYAPHWVNLVDPQMPRCDCVDHDARNRLCKHLVAVLLAESDYRLWRQLRLMQEQAGG